MSLIRLLQHQRPCSARVPGQLVGCRFLCECYKRDHVKLYILLLDRPPCPNVILRVRWCSYNPQTLAKDTLDSVPIELRFYSRLVVVSTLGVPTQPDPPPPLPPHRPPLTSLFCSLDFPPPETPQPPPARSHKIVLSPSLAAPSSLLIAGGARLVSGIEPSPTARFQQASANAWLVAPNSARSGSLVPDVSLPNCVAGSN